MTSVIWTISCKFIRTNLNCLLKNFVIEPSRQNCEVYLVGDSSRITLLSPGTTEITLADDFEKFAIGLTALGPKLAKVETKG